MNTLDPRLRHIIREQLSLLSDDAGKRALVVFNIERAWREMPLSLGNPLSVVSTDELEETRLDFHTDGGCCPIGHPGESGPQGVK